MKASFKWMLLVLVALTSTARVTTAQSVAVDSVKNITTMSLDVYGNYSFYPDSTGVTYFAIADNAGMIGATPSAYIVHNDTTGTWMASFSGLNPGTQYWIQPNGITQVFEFFSGLIVAVTTDTLFVWPSVSIDSLSGITTTSVTVNNTVSTGNDTLHLRVTTSTNPSFTAGLTWVDTQLPNGTTIAPVTVSGLISNTNYWVKSEVTNRVGTFVCGSIFPFTTLDAGVFSVPVSDSATVTDTTVTMYGSANIADKHWIIHGTDYISVSLWHIGEIEDYTDCGGCVVASTSATFDADPSTTYYWAFVTEYDGSVNYGTTLSITTNPIDTPYLSLTIPIVGDTSASSIGFCVTTKSTELFVMYGQPIITIGTQYTPSIFVGSGVSDSTFALHNLLAGTNGEAVLCAVVSGDTIYSSITTFTTTALGAVVAFSGYVTSANVDPSFTMETIYFAFISENDIATVWVDIADSSDVGFVYPYPGGLPHTFQSYGGTAYDTIPVSATLASNHAYRCRISGYNSANGTLFTSAPFLFNTYQDGSIGTFYSTPYVPINNGDDATLHWATSNASSVTISGIGVVANNGSISTGPLTETTTFTLTVLGLSGNVTSEEVTVEVEPTAVEVVDDLVQMILIFNDQFSVNFPEARVVQVYNLSGVKVFESDVYSSTSYFDLNQPAGMYLCRTIDTAGIISPAKKIILVH